MASVIYNGNKLIPAPQARIGVEFLKNAQEEIIGSRLNITLLGQLMSWRGSPTSSGTFWTQSNGPPDEGTMLEAHKLGSILAKQNALETLFATQGQILQIIDDTGINAFQCNPLSSQVEFAEGIWVENCPYTITLMANGFPVSGLNLKDAKEEWVIELGDQPESDILPQSFRMQHNLSAQGLLVYNANGTFTPPYIYAQNFVLSRLGFNSTIATASGVLNLPSFYNGYNQVRSENLDKQAGTFGVSENWILTSGNVIEDFTVNRQDAIESPYISVSIQGSVQGLETRDTNYQLTTTKYQAASGAFNSIQNILFSRAKSYSNTDNLNFIPMTQDIGRNPVAGNISYSYQYNTRPSNYVSGAKNEMISIVDNLAGDIFAMIPILFRAAGPIFQNLGTKTEKSRQLTLELLMPSVASLGVNVAGLQNTFNTNPRFNPGTSGAINDIIVAATPTTFIVSPFTTNPQEAWEPRNGRYSYTRTWVFE